MKRSELHYDLPPELIAQQPAEPRDAARLLVLDRATGHIEHRVFRDIGEYLAPGDCLVLNDTEVIPARFFCRRRTGGRVEGLFLRQAGANWRVLLKPSARLKVGECLSCDGVDARLVLTARHDRGEWALRPEPNVPVMDLLGRIGRTPLPPYIHRDQVTPGELERADRQRYQTVYAERPGAVAAPTAGLHFTPALLDALGGGGIGQARVTLHVGAGTFAPIVADDLAGHDMHAEWFEVGDDAAERMRAARAGGGRLVAVGTTATRVLETLGRQAEASGGNSLAASGGWTDVFIYPPHAFRNVDCLITNFHLPGSTLLALVMAFATPNLIRTAYRAAIAERYRFYSYGDAMLIR